MPSMRAVLCGLAATAALAEPSTADLIKNVAATHCSDRGGCDCDCSWASQSTCGQDDGSCCHACCCTAPGPAPGPSPGPSPSPTPGAAYCPSAADLGFDYNGGGGSIRDQGWTIRGGARVHTRAAFNLLGGFIEFDLDVSGAHTGVNNNLYTISPDVGGGAYDTGSQYCDGQAPGGKFCMELDVIESNGNCGGATTLHTHLGYGGGCDQGGCQGSYHFNGQTKFHVKAEWSATGEMTTYVGSQTVTPGSMHPYPDGSAVAVVADTMRSKGAVIQSSQWTGWVPVGDCGTSGDLGSSVFSVSNLRIKGTVVQGPQPRGCAAVATNATEIVI